MSKKLEMEEYLNNTAKPVMEDLLLSILSSQPKNIVIIWIIESMISLKNMQLKKKVFTNKFGGKFDVIILLSLECLWRGLRRRGGRRGRRNR